MSKTTTTTTLDPSMAGYERKAFLLERALDDFARGRLCQVDRCLTRAAVVLVVRRRRQVEVGVCRRHATDLDRGDVRLAVGWRLVGRRARRSGEVVDGPATS